MRFSHFEGFPGVQVQLRAGVAPQVVIWPNRGIDQRSTRPEAFREIRRIESVERTADERGISFGGDQLAIDPGRRGSGSAATARTKHFAFALCGDERNPWR